MIRKAALLAMMPLVTLLAACGLQPMYAGGSSGTVARRLSGIEVPPIPGRAGWLMRNALQDRLGNNDTGASRYRLDVRLDDSLEGLGVLGDDTIGRERRTLRARYQLVDLSTDTIIVDATAGSDAGIDVVGSEYATIAAEQRALENLTQDVADQIVVRLTRALRDPAE